MPKSTMAENRQKSPKIANMYKKFLQEILQLQGLQNNLLLTIMVRKCLMV